MADDGVHVLASQAEYQKAVAKGGVMVIDCFAVWCGPCKVIAPKVVELAKKYPTASFYKVDVDAVPDVAQELAIRAMPTFKIFKDGELVDSIVGASVAPLEEAVKKAMA